MKKYITKYLMNIARGLIIAEVVDIFRRKPKLTKKVASGSIESGVTTVMKELIEYNKSAFSSIKSFLTGQGVSPERKTLTALKKDVEKLRNDSEKLLEDLKKIG